MKGVKKVLSALHHKILNHFKKEMMQRNCIFHEPVILCYISILTLCLTLNVFTRLCLLWVLSFNHSRNILYFPKIVTFLFWLVYYSLAV